MAGNDGHASSYSLNVAGQVLGFGKSNRQIAQLQAALFRIDSSGAPSITGGHCNDNPSAFVVRCVA